MIQSLRLDHFRSHQHLELNDLGRVNLLLGKNNSGKTAVLEALLLAALPSQTPQVVRLLGEARTQNTRVANPRSVEDAWSGLFFAWDFQQPVRISWSRLGEDLGLFDSITRSLGISVDYQEDVGTQTLFNFGENVNFLSPLVSAKVDVMAQGQSDSYEYRLDNQGNIGRVTPYFTREADVPISFLPARGSRDTEAEARRFSFLEVERREGEVEEALRIIEPRLKRLTVIASSRSSAIYGDIGYGRLVPLGLMGDGMLRLLSIAQSLVHSSQGIVLIDEAENGLHFSVLEDVWRLIFETTRRLNVQVFATTHSDECLAAATRAAHLVGASDELRAFRLEQEGARSRVAAFSSNNLGYALANGFEVRG